MSERSGGGLLGTRVVLGALVAIIVVAVLFTPEPAQRDGDPRLTSRSASAQGARGLAESLRRLGWTVDRREAAYAGMLSIPPESGAVHAVLAPPTELRATEVGALLAAVRRGGALLTVVQRNTALADSLGLAPSRGSATLDPDSADIAGCPDGPWGRGGLIAWGDGQVQTLWLARAGKIGIGDTPAPRALDAIDFLEGRVGFRRTRRGEARFAAARGFSLGRGRVVAIADPDLLRNDVLRVCRWGAGVAVVRMTDWLAGAPAAGRRIVFDEFHQGEASRPAPVRVVARALAFTRGGRAVIALGAAALLLLAAAAVRALPPSPRPRTARRSPLEHVDALARAYAAVGATRLVARRLARGLRRRHGRGAARARGPGNDETFLHAVALRHPHVASDVDALRRAMETRVADPRAIAAAAAAIERALTPRTAPTVS